ncbi:MAG: TonB-dependent receptor [Marinoscillum sp.]
MKYWIGALAIASAVMLEAQTLTGIVYDKLNNEPLVGATVSVSMTQTGTSTNTKGRYMLYDVEMGRVSLVVTYVGYEAMRIDDVWVKAGKITEQDIYLSRSNSDLDEVVIMAPKPMIEPGRISITEEQINRFAATYYDPARLITSSPDVAVTNDQNNQVSVRGLSPSYNVWRLEGAEIVNPNHLSNAGTFLDQPSATGGGVNILSAQMLDRSSFLYSTFDNRYGNSVGGVFDMNLKTGTDQDRQYTAQASLIGLDLAAEGPFRHGGKVTYAANYRYSFTGLLTSFGVDFGGESIGFQDLSFAISSPLGDRSKLKVFGVGGLSFNDFTHKPYDESEVQKDRSDIYYDNKTGIIGATWETGYDQGKVSLNAVYSATDNRRNLRQYDFGSDQFNFNLNNRTKNEIISLNVSNKVEVGSGTVEAGMIQNFYQIEYSNTSDIIDQSILVKQWLSRPFVRMNGQLGSSLTGYLGLGASITDGDQVVEPRAGLTLGVGKAHSLSLGAGVYSQLLSPMSYWFDAGYGETNWSDDPGFYALLKSYRGTFSHDITGRDYSLHTEVFYYYFPEVNSVTSDDQLTAYTNGLSLTFEKDFSKSTYLKVGGSLFDSEVKVYENYYNSQYNFNLSTGKEWDLSNAVKNRRLSVDLRGMYQGGYQNYLNPQILVVNAPPSDYYDNHPYIRFDLRVVWKRYHENRTSSIALDLQNVANIQNQAYQYYDGFTNQWEVQNNLGLIPILAYRVEW